MRLLYFLISRAIAVFVLSHSPESDPGELNIWWTIVLVANVASFGLFALDKCASMVQFIRVPESLLIASTASLGGVGTLACQGLLNHKTSKSSFVVKNIIACLVSTALYVYFLDLL